MFEFYKNALQGTLGVPLCADYKAEWRRNDGNKEKLVQFVMRQQSCPYFAHHCYMDKGLTKDYLRREFADYINGYTIHDADGVEGYTYGLYVDYDYDNDLVMDKDVAHVMWTVGANIVVPQTKCPILYVSNRSNVHLICEGFNIVKIYLFDRSTVTVEELDNDSSVVVYEYSRECKTERGKYCLSDNIKEFRKELRL